MLEYDFMVRALVVGVLVAACAALVGVPLVLRRNSMIGDGLSHVAFAAFALATALGWAPLWFALPVMVVASFLILRLSKSRRLYGDAAIAVLSAASLALGTMAISVSRGVNIDLNSYLFGSILAVGVGDVIMSVILAVGVGMLYMVAYHRIFAITFDEDFARAAGVRTGRYDALFALICSVLVVVGMRLLGSLLISSLIIFPALTAMRLARTFKGVVSVAALVAVVAFVAGLAISYAWALPTGATVVVVNLLMFILASVGKAIVRSK